MLKYCRVPSGNTRIIQINVHQILDDPWLKRSVWSEVMKMLATDLAPGSLAKLMIPRSRRTRTILQTLHCCAKRKGLKIHLATDADAVYIMRRL